MDPISLTINLHRRHSYISSDLCSSWRMKREKYIVSNGSNCTFARGCGEPQREEERMGSFQTLPYTLFSESHLLCFYSSLLEVLGWETWLSCILLAACSFLTWHFSKLSKISHHPVGSLKSTWQESPLFEFTESFCLCWCPDDGHAFAKLQHISAWWEAFCFLLTTEMVIKKEEEKRRCW